MKKRFKIIILSFLAAFVFSSPFNLSYAVTAEDSGPCTATGSNVFSGSNTACRFTPQIYKAKVYEMGLCTVNPMAGASLDRTTCTTVFTATDQTNGSEHDFALGDVDLAFNQNNIFIFTEQGEVSALDFTGDSIWEKSFNDQISAGLGYGFESIFFAILFAMLLVSNFSGFLIFQINNSNRFKKLVWSNKAIEA